MLERADQSNHDLGEMLNRSMDNMSQPASVIKRSAGTGASSQQPNDDTELMRVLMD